MIKYIYIAFLAIIYIEMNEKILVPVASQENKSNIV